MGQSGSGGGSAEHLARLDMLRGIAVLSVLWYHWMPRSVELDRLPWKGLWSDFAAASPAYWFFYPISHGWAAVPAFFVLSGFVIHLSTLKVLARGNQFDAISFLWRRFWRIYPVYAIAVLTFGLSYRFSKFDIITHLLCIHNFFEPTLFSIAPAFWSLASEVQFYLVYPFIVPLLLRGGVLPALKYSFLLSLVVIGLTAVFLDPAVRTANLLYWWSPLITWSSWLLGAYLAERYHRKQEPMRVSAGWIAGGILLFLFSMHFRLLFPFAFTIASLLAAVWIDRMAQSHTPLANWERAFVGVGVISYSIYVWHHPLLDIFNPMVTTLLQAVLSPEIASANWFPVLKMAAGILPVVGIMCLLGWLSYHLIEKKGNQLGAVLWQKLQGRVSKDRVPELSKKPVVEGRE